MSTVQISIDQKGSKPPLILKKSSFGHNGVLSTILGRTLAVKAVCFSYKKNTVLVTTETFHY